MGGNPINSVDPLGLWPRGAPESGFNFSGIHVPSRKSVISQLHAALRDNGVCTDDAEARKAAEDIVEEVGRGDLPFAKVLNEALSNRKPLSKAQKKS